MISSSTLGLERAAKARSEASPLPVLRLANRPAHLFTVSTGVLGFLRATIEPATAPSPINISASLASTSGAVFGFLPKDTCTAWFTTLPASDIFVSSSGVISGLAAMAARIEELPSLIACSRPPLKSSAETFSCSNMFSIILPAIRGLFSRREETNL